MFKLCKQTIWIMLLITALCFPSDVQATKDTASFNQAAFLKWFGKANAEYEKTLGIQLKEFQADKVTLKIAIAPDKHINYFGIVHGGAIMSLADTAMAAACANQGAQAITVDFNINFIRKVAPKGTVTAVAYVLHHGRQTMVAEAEIYDNDNRLAAKARGTFFVTGKIEEEFF